MTVRMNSNFINYSDFLDILVEAFQTAPRNLFEKMIQMITSTLHQQVVELQKQALQIDEMSLIPVNDLEEYYDGTLDAIDDVKLLKKRLDELKEKDALFATLYMTIDNLHQSLVQHIDRMGQLEIRVLSKEQSA
jgi:FtsZ-binding cell division protein ZapB